MTTSPALSAAPVPAPADPAPGTSISLKPGTAPSPIQGAAIEAAAWTGKLVVGPAAPDRPRVEYDLVPILSAYDMVVLQEASDTGKYREIIEAIQQLVAKPQREALVAQLLSDPDDPLDRLTIDDCIAVLENGMEQIAARPTDR